VGGLSLERDVVHEAVISGFGQMESPRTELKPLHQPLGALHEPRNG
jgi:hypothetical protein